MDRINSEAKWSPCVRLFIGLLFKEVAKRIRANAPSRFHAEPREMRE